MTVEERIKPVIESIDSGTAVVSSVIDCHEFVTRLIAQGFLIWFIAITFSALNGFLASVSFAGGTGTNYFFWMFDSCIAGYMFLISRDLLDDIDKLIPAKKKMGGFLKQFLDN